MGPSSKSLNMTRSNHRNQKIKEKIRGGKERSLEMKLVGHRCYKWENEENGGDNLQRKVRVGQYKEQSG